MPSRRPLFLRLLDALLFSSIWLALAAAAQTAVALQLLPGGFGPTGRHVMGLVFAVTVLTYNLDAVLPFKHRQPVGTSGRKAWIHAHRWPLAALAAAAALGGAVLLLLDGWLHYLPLLLPLAALALGYSLPLLPWRGRWRALREVPLLKVFLIGGVWSIVTVELPALALHHPLGSLNELLLQRFLLVSALAIVFDIRDYSRDRLTGLQTMPVVLGLTGAKVVSLTLLAGALALGLWRGAHPAEVLLPGALAAWVIAVARDTRGDYFFALVADGVLLVQAAAYFVV